MYLVINKWRGPHDCVYLKTLLLCFLIVSEFLVHDYTDSVRLMKISIKECMHFVLTSAKYGESIYWLFSGRQCLCGEESVRSMIVWPPTWLSVVCGPLKDGRMHPGKRTLALWALGSTGMRSATPSSSPRKLFLEPKDSRSNKSLIFLRGTPTMGSGFHFWRKKKELLADLPTLSHFFSGFTSHIPFLDPEFCVGSNRCICEFLHEAWNFKDSAFCSWGARLLLPRRVTSPTTTAVIAMEIASCKNKFLISCLLLSMQCAWIGPLFILRYHILQVFPISFICWLGAFSRPCIR